MRFAALDNAVLGQSEVGTGVPPGAGGMQHLARLLGRGRAMEVILGSEDFDAATAGSTALCPTPNWTPS